MHIEDLLIELIILTITPIIVGALRACFYEFRRTGKGRTPGKTSKGR